MALLELRSVVGGYVEGIDILNGVELTVEAGSLTGIIGPNGAGKSTLLKTVFGFLHPRGGRIAFDGRDISADVPHVIKRLGIGYVPQGTNTFPQLTVHENLQLGAWVFRRDAARVRRDAGAGLRRVSPAGREAVTARDRAVRRRSQDALDRQGDGDRPPAAIDRRAVGRAVAEDHRAGLWASSSAARARGLTILLVDQNIAKAVEISDYLYMLEMGTVRRAGPRQAFADQLRELIRDALLGV